MAALARYVLTANVTIPWPATWSETIQGAANIPVVTPAVPATGIPVSNPYGVAVAITVTGGTVTAISTGSNSSNLSATSLVSGTVFLPNDWAIALTYSAAPTWSWLSAQLPQSGASSQVAAVSSPAPPGGQLGTIPQFLFAAGTPFWLDSAGPLYAALGGGNLRAWIDGTDVVGRPGISN
jgi:hypothetical protein